MTFTHDDIQARLIEFLYGELDGGARAAFDAHIGACESCRVEVNAFAQTRATARAVVRAPLAEPVPAAVRARVMEAAMRASAERASAARGPTVRAPRPDGGTTSRWLGWLRGRWTLPMLTTVAAMGALLLFRETIFREARRPLGDTTVDELLPKPAPEPAEGAASGSQTGGAEAEKAAEVPEPDPSRERVRTVAGGIPAKRIAPASKGESVKAAKKALKPAKAKADSFGFGAGALGRSEKKDGVDQLLGKMGSDKGARPADVKAEQTKPERRSLDALLEGATSRSERRPRAQEEEDRAPAKSVSDDFEAERDQGRAGFAQPPPPAARKPVVAAAPAPASVPRAPAPRASAGSPAAARVVADEEAAEPSPPSGSSDSDLARDAPSAASSEKKSKARAKSAEAPAPPASPATAAGEPAVGTKMGGASRPAADPAAVLVDRAEKLMTARRFAEAAAAYQDLLRRFPQHAAAPTWRRRLAAAQTARAQELNQPGDSGFATPPAPR